MSKIIKYNDYIQINPDQRILTLDKSEKIVLTDNLLNRAYTSGKGLLVTYDLSHSGRKINNRVYSTQGQQRGIESLTSPYPKPILKNHDQHSEPVGRFVGGEWQELSDETISFFDSQDSYLDFRNAFIEDDPKRIYNSLKKNNLLNNKKWPGLGRMRVQANITDEDAIKKFLDGRYLTFSAGSTTNRHVCSICENDWATDGICEHRHGEQYDGETCVFITGDFIVLEGSIVNTPADDLSQVLNMEITDSLEVEKDNKININSEIIITDSLYSYEGEQNGIQDTRICDGQEGSNEEKPSQEANEEESPNEEEEDVTIDPEDSLFIEELFADEQMFKVPAGAKGNAQKVLNWKKEYGSDVKGMTPVGWARARQLATQSEIPLSTVKRMSAFNRHRKNAVVAPEYKSEPWKDRGYVAWLGWGGTTGIDWAIKISSSNDSLEEESLSNGDNQVEDLDILTEDDCPDIDWEILDLALQALAIEMDAELSTEKRNSLPESSFCGPGRSFPIPDCAHVTAARRLIGRAKASESTKDKIMACVNKKAKNMSCDSEEEAPVETDMNARFEELQKKYDHLAEQFKELLSKLITKDENNVENVEVNDTKEVDSIESVENIDNNVINILDMKVENPSNHAEGEDHVIDEAGSDIVIKPLDEKLGAYERKVVESYRTILSSDGAESADSWFATQAKYLPRGFNPKNF